MELNLLFKKMLTNYKQDGENKIKNRICYRLTNVKYSCLWGVP